MTVGPRSGYLPASRIDFKVKRQPLRGPSPDLSTYREDTATRLQPSRLFLGNPGKIVSSPRSQFGFGDCEEPLQAINAC